MSTNLASERWTEAGGLVFFGDGGISLHDVPDGARRAQLIAEAPALLAACQAQHQALDILMALCIRHVPGFMPTKSPAWAAFVQSNAAIIKATTGEQL